MPRQPLKFFVTYDTHRICQDLLIKELDRHGVSYDLKTTGELIVDDRDSHQNFESIKSSLLGLGIDFVNNEKMILVEKIKKEIVNLVKNKSLNDQTFSSDLANKFNHTYSYLAKSFSELTHSTIENYTILTKIEEVKRLLIHDQLSLTEIAYKLNYSSVAHLSGQFKKKTGLTPTQFKKILDQRTTRH